MNIKRMRNLATEIFRTFNNPNPGFLKRLTILLLMETDFSLYWILKHGILSHKVENMKTIIKHLRNILILGLVPSVYSTRKTWIATSTQIKLSNIKTDLNN